jgi:hypothetical protein
VGHGGDGAAFCLICWDSYDSDGDGDYPVNIMPGESVQAAIDTAKRSDDRVTECYDLSLDVEAQLAETRAWHAGGARP